MVDLSGRVVNTGYGRVIANGGYPEITITNNAESGRAKTVDAGVGTGVSTGMYFKGVEIIWDPQFEELQTLETPLVSWNKRAYFINTKFMKYRDDDMDIVTPVRPHDTLAMYAMVNLRCALSISRATASSLARAPASSPDATGLGHGLAVRH